MIIKEFISSADTHIIGTEINSQIVERLKNMLRCQINTHSKLLSRVISSLSIAEIISFKTKIGFFALVLSSMLALKVPLNCWLGLLSFVCMYL